MQDKRELVNILRAELTLLTREILQDTGHKKFKELYRATRKLYEKMATIKSLSEDFDDEEILTLLEAKAPKTTKQPDKISKPPKDIEMPQATSEKEESPAEKKPIDQKPLYKKVSEMKFEPVTSKSDKPVQEPEKVTSDSSNFTPKTPSKKISIGLNDRIAFIKNLFEGNADAYSQTIKKLDTCDSYEKALEYIHKEVKPKYHQWENKDEYEFRLIQLLELKFA